MRRNLGRLSAGLGEWGDPWAFLLLTVIAIAAGYCCECADAVMTFFTAGSGRGA